MLQFIHNYLKTKRKKIKMAGRFDGLTDSQWELISTFVCIEISPLGGRPFTNIRNVFNSILWVMITGARWCDIPNEPQFAKRSTSHRWLTRRSKDGTLAKLQLGMVELADLQGKIDWERASIDGSFSPRKGWR